MTITGIYHEDDGTIVFAGPVRGEPRPKGFGKLGEVVRLRPARETRPGP